MEELHDRMPVILEPEDWSAWLGEVEAILIRCFGRRMMMCGRFGRLASR
jgi:putative SOS response-associated peptidase YedK